MGEIQELHALRISTDKNKQEKTSVAYHGGSSHFFGIGIYPVSDWLGIGIFGRYCSPLFCIVPPFLYRSPLFSLKGGYAPQKGGHQPPFEEKRGQLPPF